MSEVSRFQRVRKLVKECGIKLSRQAIKKLPLSGFEDVSLAQVKIATHLASRGQNISLVPLLPGILSMAGKPLSLVNHFPFEPFFRNRLGRRTLLKCGRQVGKSVSISCRLVLLANSISFFNQLFVSPQFEMTRRFSSNNVKALVEESPLKALLIDRATSGSVLQRTFRNRSKIIFSHAFGGDATRIRGISADHIHYDEIQDLSIDVLPIAREVMSGSEWNGIEAFAGTPKSMENTIQVLWSDSSQAEWVIKCGGCGYTNVPSISHDLDAMIGPWHDSISERYPGIVCRKCRGPLYSREGFWVHSFKERRWEFPAYHMPQIIMPFHYANPVKWKQLLAKRKGEGNTAPYVFYNEVCGESYDSGAKIITDSDLRSACVLPWSNKLDEALAHKDEYPYLILSCDWGGGGKKGTSQSVYVVMGMQPTGQIDVLYAFRSIHTFDHELEGKYAFYLAAKFGCQFIAHDYTGAGALREQFVVQTGFPLRRIIPVAYVKAASGLIMRPIPATVQHPRDFYRVDKTRSLQLTCNQIRQGKIRFFRYDYVSSGNKGLIRDFLSLVEERNDTRTGSPSYTIIRDPTQSDDFAQAVNIGACALWYKEDAWPDIAELSHLEISAILEDLYSGRIEEPHDIHNVAW